MEAKDVLALLASVDLGLLAAALTLLAIYPAIGALLKAALGQAFASTLIGNERLREAALSSLKWSIISSWVALMVVVLQVLGGFAWRLLHPPAKATAGASYTPCWEVFCLGTSGVLTFTSISLLAIAARQIFKASSKMG